MDCISILSLSRNANSFLFLGIFCFITYSTLLLITLYHCKIYLTCPMLNMRNMEKALAYRSVLPVCERIIGNSIEIRVVEICGRNSKSISVSPSTFICTSSGLINMNPAPYFFLHSL